MNGVLFPVEIAGRKVLLSELHQSYTYANLFVGYPDAITNREFILEPLTAVARYAEHDWRRNATALIPPETSPLLDGEPVPDRIVRSGRPPEFLPRWTCTAELSALHPAPGRGDGDYSVLLLTWFQNELAFPIDPSVAAKMAELDWDAHAWNVSD